MSCLNPEGLEKFLRQQNLRDTIKMVILWE
jgi:hypothetical protein